MLKKLTIVLSVLVVAAIMFGCTDRGTGIDARNYSVRSGFTALAQDGGHEFAFQLGHSMFQAVHLSPKLDYRVYVPPGYEEATIDKLPLPVLYLLAPFKGNSHYYINHGLFEVADRMIANGEIKPMFIVCIDGSAGYGGTFYGDTYGGGKYAEIIGDIKSDPTTGSMIDWLESFLPTISGRGNRGIAGFEMGGYGAVRIGLEYSENFGTVSAVSAPLDFDGNGGSGGFVSLFGEVVNNLGAVDFREMDSSSAYPLRTMILAAGCAFSPHISYDDIFFDTVGIGVFEAASSDTTFFEDTLTLFTPEGSESGIAFHLPFNSSGLIPSGVTEISWPDSSIMNVDTLAVPWDTTWALFTSYDTIGYYDSVWNLWMNNNPENILTAHPGAIDSLDIQLITLNDDSYDFDQQTRDFGQAVGLQVTNIEGYEGFDASNGRFIYDILPKVLKYHSDRFSLNQE